jgi:ketosteroid isomerase-like protein
MNAFNERDVGAVLELTDPEMEFYAPLTARAVGRLSSYQGHDGIRQYFDDVGSVWDSLEVTPEEFRSANNHVVVLGTIVGQREGERIDDQVGWAWKLRDGKAVWGRVYPASEEALKDAGIK